MVLRSRDELNGNRTSLQLTLAVSMSTFLIVTALGPNDDDRLYVDNLLSVCWLPAPTVSRLSLDVCTREYATQELDIMGQFFETQPNQPKIFALVT